MPSLTVLTEGSETLTSLATTTETLTSVTESAGVNGTYPGAGTFPGSTRYPGAGAGIQLYPLREV